MSLFELLVSGIVL